MFRFSNSDQPCNLVNTCPVDNWLFLFKILSVVRPDIMAKFEDRSIQNSKPVKDLIGYIKVNNYTSAKVLVVTWNGIKVHRWVLNLSGHEFERVLCYIRGINEYIDASACSSPFCAKTVLETDHRELVSISAEENVTREKFSSQIYHYLFNPWESICGRSLDALDVIPPPDFVYSNETKNVDTSKM